METYRGDTLLFDFSANNEDGTSYTFMVGDTVKVGIKGKKTNPKCALLKTINITEETETIPVVFSATEMGCLCEGDKIMEVELTTEDGVVRTLYQDTLKIKGDVINE